MGIIITPLYEVLIYLEEVRVADYERLKKWGAAISRGVLGKMEAMGLISRKKSENNRLIYSLSPNGYKLLNSVLDTLHQEVIHWDGKWRVVFFTVSEKERPQRDKFRRRLEALGLKPILNSAWITPLDRKAQIEDAAMQYGLSTKFILIESSEIFGLSNGDILKIWDFSKYRNHYEDFIKISEKTIEDAKRTNFDIKRMIFEYALILNSEPQVPIELVPKDWPKFRANLQYKKLRRLIT